ncbi:ABC transporter permease [Ruminococcus sp. Marseille-P328]|uniref:ABC transporter permease n=1 Tax=Ruminococcus sp. Marseille-P328 TaxID=1816688 RepID=UPI0035621913
MFGKKYATIRKLANRNIIEHKFRHALNIIVVMCLTIFISAFEIVSSSTYSNVEEDYLKQNGNASQIQAFDVPLESFENFKMDNIEEIGQSVYIGNAVNDEFRNRPSELRYADSNYAEYMFSLPIQGRMPENKNEIAVDRSVLEDLEKDATLGTDITIYWLDEDKKEQSQTFEVVGIWEENSLYTTRNLWVSKDFIKKMNTNIDLAFNLKSGKVNNKTLDEVAEKLQIEEEQVISNWVYEDNVQKQIRLETLVYKIGASFILLCGFLILYNIIAISIASDRKLYGRIKTLGASPKQVKLSVFYQYFFDVLIGIPLGLALGYILGSKMVPVVITSLDNDIHVYADVKNFISTILLILLVVFVSGIRPAYRACAVDPSDILSEENNLNFRGKTHRRSPGVPALFELSLSNLVRYPKRNVIAIILLTVGLVLTSCVYVINHSFDISKYMAEIALSDITITEKTLVESWGEYNPKGNTITKEFMEKLEASGDILEQGVLYSQDISLQTSETAYNNVIQYYEQNKCERLKYMEQDVAWTEGYQSFKQTGKCTATIFGIDGLLNDKITDKNRIIDGTIDKEKFLSGKYMIAQGYSSDSGEYELQPTYNVGDKISLNGKEFEIMAIAEVPYPITEGKTNPGSEFNLTFYVPSSSFLEMYPENTPRKWFLNVEKGKENEIENILKPYMEKGVPIETEKTIEQNYNNATKSATLLQNIVSIMILVIGIVNFANVIIISVTSRKKEFAMMQSIGMTKKQLRLLLMMEGINISIITLIISYFLSLVTICVGVSAYLQTQWTATYHFSITPLLIVTPVLIILPIVISLICFQRIQKIEIIERLQDEDEVGTV